MSTICNNQHWDFDECPCRGEYAAVRASGEVLDRVYANNEAEAYDKFEDAGLAFHYVEAI